MASSQNQTIVSIEEKEELLAKKIAGSLVLPMVLKAAIELDLFEILAKAGKLSSSEIASYLPTHNPQAPAMLERMLRYLACNSILTSTLTMEEDNHATDQTKSKRFFYGLTSLGKHFVQNEDGVSLAAALLFYHDKVNIDAWGKLKDAVLEGGIPFDKAHGMPAFAYTLKDSRYDEAFNKAMYTRTIMDMKMILEIYKGFEGVKEVIDVGGCFGATLEIIVSKYPAIKGINFDLPHVIKNVPPYPGVKHIGGDMFESVPKVDVMFMKWILHDWSDDHCLKLLKNCWNALPKSGKVVVMEAILPEHPDTDLLSENVFRMDAAMMMYFNGGKERTLEEFKTLARGSGFAAAKLICRASTYSIMEFHKTV